MRVFRGTKGIAPHLINPRHIGQAMYGDATYFAVNKSDAQMYSSGGDHSCSVVGTYLLDPKRLLTISSTQWDIENISDAQKPLKISASLQEDLDYQNDTLAPVNLAKLAQQSAFDAVLLTGIVEGGQQVVVPPNSLEPVLESLEVVLNKRLLGYTKNNDHFQGFLNALGDFGVFASETESSFCFTLSPLQLKQTQELFEFIFGVCQNQTCLEINFSNFSLEHYEE